MLLRKSLRSEANKNLRKPKESAHRVLSFFEHNKDISAILWNRMQMLGSKYTARTPEVQEAYDRHRTELWDLYGDNPPCPFCETGGRVILEETATMLVVRNDFPYESFDGQRILQHLMITPRRHIALLEDFNVDEEREYWQLMAVHHKKGFSSLTRSAIDTFRSVPEHLHTHLFFYLPEEA